MISTDKIVAILKSVRTTDWWESKFGALFAVIYATAILISISFYELFAVIGFLLLALIPGACFVSIINDLTDIEADKLVGKKNFFSQKSDQFGYFLIIICLLIGTTVCLFLSKVSLFLYLAAWLIFTSYSIPPIRLKNRGVLGVLADALGAYLFPQLFVIAVLSDWFDKDINFVWFTAVGIWSFCLGLRGILSHQLTDRKNDAKAKIKTFIQKYQNQTIKNLVAWLIFPLELIGLIAMFWLSQNHFALISLAIYSILTILGYYYAGIKFSVVNTSKSNRLLMNEYYCIFLPLSFLIFGLLPLENSWLIIILHLILFAKSIIRVVGEAGWIFYYFYFGAREFLLGY
jgi:4-hydroxybenzoate polyprenyltransferase